MENELKKRGIDADVKVDEKGGAECVEIRQGDQRMGNNLSLPDGFPKDVAVSGGWNVIHSGPSPQGGFMLQAIAPEDRAAILAALRSGMAANGWTETAFDQPAPPMTRIAFEKENRMTNYNITDNGGTFMVQMLTMVKP